MVRLRSDKIGRIYTFTVRIRKPCLEKGLYKCQKQTPKSSKKCWVFPSKISSSLHNLWWWNFGNRMPFFQPTHLPRRLRVERKPLIVTWILDWTDDKLQHGWMWAVSHGRYSFVGLHPVFGPQTPYFLGEIWFMIHDLLFTRILFSGFLLPNVWINSVNLKQVPKSNQKKWPSGCAILCTSWHNFTIGIVKKQDGSSRAGVQIAEWSTEFRQIHHCYREGVRLKVPHSLYKVGPY